MQQDSAQKVLNNTSYVTCLREYIFANYKAYTHYTTVSQITVTGSNYCNQQALIAATGSNYCNQQALIAATGCNTNRA